MNRITRIPSNGPLKSPFAPRTDVVVEEETTKVVEEKPGVNSKRRHSCKKSKYC